MKKEKKTPARMVLVERPTLDMKLIARLSPKERRRWRARFMGYLRTNLRYGSTSLDGRPQVHAGHRRTMADRIIKCARLGLPCPYGV